MKKTIIITGASQGIGLATAKRFLEDNSDKAIVQAIINLANIFNLKVQAEGVETKEHEQLLQYLNCNLAQGYFYNKPLPLNVFLDSTQMKKNEE